MYSNRVTSGPERASAADMSCPADAPKPSVTSTVDTVPIATIYPQVGEEVGNPGWEYLGCAQDNATARALYATMGSNLTTMTVESCQNFCAWKGYVLGKRPWHPLQRFVLTRHSRHAVRPGVLLRQLLQG